MINNETDDNDDQQTIILGLGSNLGNKFENILYAIVELTKNNNVHLLEVSNIYESKALGFKGDNFYNLTLAISSPIDPHSLLDLTQQIETSTGRKKNKSVVRDSNYSSRKIDIDILFYGNKNINTVDLIIPHPEINKRLFVTKPLQDMNFLLPSLRSENTETHDVLLKSQEAVEIKTSSKRLKTILKRLQLLK
jgi:2-amino-4-hydroxy-6-hydroxymethyldihydropteridine diphosphokinase